MKRDNMFIALMGGFAVLLLLLSSCSLIQAPIVVDNDLEDSQTNEVNNSAILEENINKFLTNEGKDNSNVPSAPSLNK